MEPIFMYIENRGGYVADIPGRLLNVAKYASTSIPLEDGGRVCLTTTPWYDPETVSGHKDGIYGEMGKISEFDNHSIYRVFYICKQVKVKYMFAIRLPL